MPMARTLAGLVPCLSTLLLASLHAQGTPVGFVEDFALAADRGKALEQLIPGTVEHAFYRCLLLQQTGRLDEVPPVLRGWIERHGRSSLTTEIEHRQALLRYGRDPQGTVRYLVDRLGLHFDHQRRVGGTPPDLPTRLDPEVVSLSTLTKRALASPSRGLDGFTDAALPGLAASQLDDAQLMSLLARLQRPDVSNLPALVVRNLDDPHSGGFGSLPIQKRLLLSQLEECARLRPTLLDQRAFIDAYVLRLRPSADVQWQRDPATRLAYLERLQAFVDRLPPAQNSLKAHVAHHRLRHDLATGTLDRDRLLAYLRLPRTAPWVNGRYLERTSEVRVDLGSEFPTGLPAVRDDADLVRTCLAHFLRDADGIDAFREYVDADYLRRLLAETKILAGAGDMQRWYSLLNDPSYYERLEARVDLDFAPTQPDWFAAEQPVAIEVDVKNVPTLLVRVYEIDTFNYYREVGREVDAAIDLDGLSANVEQTFTYDTSPLRRVRRRFELEALTRPGVYVVELIGNGRSSRAVVHKGRLQYTQRLGAAGQVLRVLDEAGNLLRDAHVWFGNRDYAADADGEVVVPFSTDPGPARLVLQHGTLATLETLQHHGEDYRLVAAVHVDREALLARRVAKLLVRPQLVLDDQPVSLELVEQPVLTLTATDVFGVVTAQDVRGFELPADRESVHEFTVPDDLMSLRVELRGKVKSLTRGETVDLVAPPRLLELNGIDATDATACPLLLRTPAGWVVELRGKEGEPLADRAVQLVLQHRLFTDPVSVSLETDAGGRVHLGPLPGITTLRVSGFPDEVSAFALRTQGRTYPARVTGVAGTTLRVPYQGQERTATRTAVSLLELRAGAFARDAFDHVALAAGFVELRGLEPGDYDLWLAEDDVHVEVKVTAGAARHGLAVGRDRLLELVREGVQIESTTIADDALDIALANARPQTRVHVLAGRYLPAFDPLAWLAAVRQPLPSADAVEHGGSSYHAGRDIGDEYRYVLERRLAPRFPGNMLRRPSLLLNPWALDETTTETAPTGRAGGQFGGRGGKLRADAVGGNAPATPAPTRAPGTFPDLDFLPAPATVLPNLRADADGHVRVPLAQLGAGQLIGVVAIDGDDTVYVSLTRPETPFVPVSQRLPAAIASDRHAVERRRIEFLAAGDTARLADAGSAKAQTYDSLAAVFQLFATLAPGSDLTRFAFLLDWPQLPPATKRDLYSRFACHELHFFLQQKDPEFFDQVVRPFLAAKLDRTFLDDWLLQADLTPYLEPRAFARLNVVERILLARRLPAAAAGVRRLVGDTFELLPPDLERSARLFESALAGEALAGKKTGVRQRLAEAERNKAQNLPETRPAEELAGREAAPALQPAPADKAEEEKEVAADRDVEAAKDERRREQQQRLYRAPDPTRRLVEQNYWHRRIEEHDAGLITVNAFWHDFATADPARPFVSQNLAEATHSLAEMLLALAVLDLPFSAGEHTTQVEGGALTLRAASPLLLVRKEIVDAEAAAAAGTVLVNENFFQLGKRYEFVGNERRDAWVEGEFVVGVPYGCQVVVTNPGSTPRQLELLLQVPQGAIPVRGSAFTRGLTVRLEAYGTTSVEYAFYFPLPGQQPHYPVHVAERGRLVAFAAPTTMNVVTTPTNFDETSWDWVAQNGSAEAVLAFLERGNLLRLDLGAIAWRMRDRAFFTATLTRLRERLVYEGVLWSYGFLHADSSAMREYLRHADAFLLECGRALESPLVSIDPVERRTYQHVEFEPLFNARAHRFGHDTVILNRALAEQYLALLAILAERDALAADDWLAVTYYLALQDRVEDAQRAFARVEPARLAASVQYDYMRAYLDFYTQDHTVARGVAERYRDYPVPHWRARFQEVLQQLDEADGKARGDAATGDDPALQQGVLAAAQPALDLAVEARRVTLRYRNLDRCAVRYYPMDVEFLFSTHPFVQQGDAAFAYIRASRTEPRDLPAGGELTFDLPAEFQNGNVLVEVRGAGITRRQAYYANSLTTQFVETYGQVLVSEAAGGRPLPRVYVKVFARTGNGHVRFFKDGYTDLRGRFDYASVSGESGDDVERLAVLVLSDDRGAVIREVSPHCGVHAQGTVQISIDIRETEAGGGSRRSCRASAACTTASGPSASRVDGHTHGAEGRGNEASPQDARNVVAYETGRYRIPAVSLTELLTVIPRRLYPGSNEQPWANSGSPTMSGLGGTGTCRLASLALPLTAQTTSSEARAKQPGMPRRSSGAGSGIAPERWSEKPRMTSPADWGRFESRISSVLPIQARVQGCTRLNWLWPSEPGQPAPWASKRAGATVARRNMAQLLSVSPNAV